MKKSINKEKVYISGRTNGLPPEAVQQKFEIAEAYIKAMGKLPINPIAERGTDKVDLASEIESLLKADSVFILDNWLDCKKSRIILKIAEEYDIPILFESMACKSVIVEKLKDAILHVMGFKFQEIIIKSRKKDLFFARMIIINHCFTNEKMNFVEIGEIINRDHTTVLHGIKTYRNEMKYNSSFRELVSKVNIVLTKCVSE